MIFSKPEHSTTSQRKISVGNNKEKPPKKSAIPANEMIAIPGGISNA